MKTLGIKIVLWHILIIFIVTWIIIPKLSISQIPDTNQYWYLGLNDPQADFYKVKQMGWDYFNSHPELDTLKGTGLKNLIRWEQFWQDRVYEYGNQDYGTYNIAFTAMNEFINQRSAFFQDAYKDNLSWHYYGPDNLTQQVMGFVSCIDLNKSGMNLDTIYAGTNASGLFKTTDGGQHWTCITDSIGMPGLGVQDVIVDPNNPSAIYIATGITTYGRGYGNGIYRSTNGGLSWQNIYSIQNPENKVVFKMLIDPENSSRLYALINDKVYRTSDGGQNWIQIFNLLTQPPSGNKRIIEDIEFKPGSNDTIYICSHGLSYSINNTQYYLTSEIWRCPNATEQENITWTRIDDTSWPFNTRIEISVTEAAPEKLFACFSFKLDGPNEIDTFALYKSNDNGDVWNVLTKRPTSHAGYGAPFAGVNEFRMEMVVSPNDTDVVYVGGYYVNKITKNGQLIETNDCGLYICNNFHVDVRELIIASGSDPGAGGNADILLTGNDGGISKTVDGAENWVNINGSGLNITQFYGLANVPSAPQFISAGCQDNGWFFYQPGTGTWNCKVHGDNYECLTNFNAPNISYSLAWGNIPFIKYTLDGGSGDLGGNIILPAETPRVDWPLIIDPVNPNIIYTGLRDVYKITKNGNAFDIEALSNFQETHQVSSGAKLSALAVWAKDPNILYAAYGDPTWKDTTCQVKKLFKTTDGGENWVDLTCNLEFVHWLGITDILIDPEDHNKAYLTLGGFSSPAGTKRVYYTGDSFINFSDLSIGLPNLPVNCIKMANVKDHQLFVANDAGVFYKDDLMEQWQIYVNGTPVTIFSDLEINRKSNLIFASTFGRGIWYTEGTLPCPEISYHDTITINSDTIWTNEMRLHHHLKVASGAQLTIQSTVYIGEENKIMIDRGGTLILDGCLLTNSCNGNYWQGIDVWGDSEKSQLQSSDQGTIELRNGATVENAIVAIATIKSDSLFHGTKSSGGIIKADDSFFKNNRTHIQYYRYANFYRWDTVYKNEIPNLSYFSNCEFSNGNSEDSVKLYGLKISGVNGIDFTRCKFKFLMEVDTNLVDINKSLVYMENAEDISFLGCQFINEANYADHPFYTPKRGIGIYCYNSSFSARPGHGLTGSYYTSFDKLTYGIKVLSISSGRQFTADSCQFNLTARGIYNSGTRYQTIISNTFILPHTTHQYFPFQYYGIYLDYCSQYHVENNLICPNTESINSCIGIIVNNSGSELNMIYRNKFEYLKYGIIAQNDNRGDDEIIGSGLKIKCNDFYRVTNNIYVGPEDAYSRSGISKYQGFFGTSDAPAGNSFSHYNPYYYPYSDYLNLQRNIIYFHHDTVNSPPGLNLVPWYYTNWSITKQNTADLYDSASCPHFPGDSLRSSLYGSISSEEAEIDTVILLLNAWIDGGNTDLLQENIDNSTPDEGYDLRNELLSNSPYLSDTVMIKASENEEVLTNALIRDVLVANPQSAKSNEVMAKLEQRVLPLPDYMVEEIEQGIFSVSQKELLEAELAYHHQQRELARISLIQSFINDTAIITKDSLMNFYSGENDRTLKYDLAFLYLSENDSLNVMNTLFSIPDNFDLTSPQQDLHDQYLDYFEIMLNLQDAGINETVLDSSQIEELYALSNGNTIPLNAYARAILQVFDTLKYIEPILLPDPDTKSVNIIQRKSNDFSEKKTNISVYPNPANRFVTIEYKLSDTGIPSLLRITDLTGVVIKQIPLKGIQNKVVIGTINLKDGLYFCNLVVGNSVRESVKLIIKH